MNNPATGRESAAPVLSVRKLSVSFKAGDRRIPVVRDIDLDVYPDEVMCIVGESGSGKSITSLAICGLLQSNAIIEGSVALEGKELTSASQEELRHIRGQDVGFIFQDPSTTLNPVLTVGRQIIEGQVVHGLAARAAPTRAVELLREVDVANPEGRVSQYPHQFSGGMRQRAVIAMAMAGKPKLIIADEPTTALDVTVQAQVLDVLAKRRQETGAAVIFITHDLGVVAEIADRVAVMYGGRIVETAPADQLFAAPRHPYTRALMLSVPQIGSADSRLYSIPGQPPTPGELPSGCVFHPRCPIGKGRSQCQQVVPDLRQISPSRKTACHFPEETDSVTGVPRTVERHLSFSTDEELLNVKNLVVHFPVKSGLLRRTSGQVHAVSGVDLSVRAGETVGLVGESGCGKTTLSRTIMGLVPATGGDVQLSGETVLGLSDRDIRQVRRRMQYVFQDPYSALNPVKTAGDIVAEPLRIHGLFEEFGGHDFIAQLFEMVGLARSMMKRFPGEFSGGQKQRIGIARALALKPKLLILDEPVAALDVSVQAQVLNLLMDLQNELRLGYLFVAHNLSVVRHISHRVAVMYFGRIVEEASRDTLYSRPLHPYTQSLLSAAPAPNPQARQMQGRIVLKGEIPNPVMPPSGLSDINAHETKLY